MIDYFKEYLKIAPFSHALWRANEAYEIEKIRFYPPMLDLGCGFGEFAGVFFDSRIEMGIDINKKDIRRAIRTGRYRKVRQADARQLPFAKNSFQTVISVSTLEHIKRVEKVFNEVYRVLKKGGLFLFTVPTSQINKYLLLPKLFKKTGFEQLAVFYWQLFNWAFKHCSMYSPEKWQALAQKSGFKILSAQGTISARGVKFFELFLPLALPTQLFKTFLGKRLLLSPQWRINLLDQWFRPLVELRDGSKSNLLIVARKSR
jgi:ubiquinone/menaquinone biosynthesis C-methylase UbiE